jgi:hypothetical protein
MLAAIATSNRSREIVLRLDLIFLRLLMMFGVLCIGGCKNDVPKPVDLPKEISVVTQPFLAALKRGDITQAEHYMGEDARDDAVDDYEPTQKALSKTTELRPIIIRYKPTIFGQPDRNDVTLIYVAKKGAVWTSLQMRLFRLEGERYEIEYWTVKQENKVPPALAQGELFKKWVMIAMLAMAVMALLFLMSLIWFVRRKRHIVAPETIIDTRPVAATRQED